MKFSTLATFAVLVIPSALAQLNPDQIVAAINVVANISQDSNNQLSSLTTSSSPNQVSEIGAVSIIFFLETLRLAQAILHSRISSRTSIL
jgi:hypothetical protein